MGKFLTRLAAAGIAALGSLPVSAMAEPVYLVCTIMVHGKPNDLNFTLDEQIGKASIMVPASGVARTVNAAFSTDKVVIEEPQVRWVINRVDLRFSRTIKLIDSTNEGHCQLQATPKRAF